MTQNDERGMKTAEEVCRDFDAALASDDRVIYIKDDGLYERLTAGNEPEDAPGLRRMVECARTDIVVDADEARADPA